MIARDPATLRNSQAQLLDPAVALRLNPMQAFDESGARCIGQDLAVRVVQLLANSKLKADIETRKKKSCSMQPRQIEAQCKACYNRGSQKHLSLARAVAGRCRTTYGVEVIEAEKAARGCRK